MPGSDVDGTQIVFNVIFIFSHQNLENFFGIQSLLDLGSVLQRICLPRSGSGFFLLVAADEDGRPDC